MLVVLMVLGDTLQSLWKGFSPHSFPIYPALVGLGFAMVFGPTRGQVADAGGLPPF